MSPVGAAEPSPTCSTTIEPAVIAWRHGLALALAVTDVDIDCDGVAEVAPEKLGAAEPERETDAQPEPVRDTVAVTDADATAETRDEFVPLAVELRENVPDALADAQLDAEFERVGEPVKDGLTVPEREPGSDGGRDGDCDGVPSCVVVRVPVAAVDAETDVVWSAEADANFDDDPQLDGAADADGEGESDLL